MPDIQPLTSGAGVTSLTNQNISGSTSAQDAKGRTITPNQNSTTGVGVAVKMGSTTSLSAAGKFLRSVTTTISSIFGPPPTFSLAIQGRFNLDNINSTANTFLGRDALTKHIDANFNSQIETLQSWVGALDTDRNPVAAGKALFTLCDLISRYDTSAFGGFKGINPPFSASNLIDKTLASNFEDFRDAQNDLANAKTALENLESSGTSSPEDIEAAKATVKRAENNVKTLREGYLKDSAALEKIKDAAAGMLNNLATAAGKKVTAPGEGATPRAQFLNEMQKVSLGAWIFNDIAPAFKKAGAATGLDLEGNLLKEFGELNTKARKTPMFSELRAPGNENVEAKKQWDAFFANEGKDVPKGKFGLRGRSGYGDKDTNTPSAPVCNMTDLEKRKAEEAKKDGKAVFPISPDTHPELKAFVPKPTARRTTVPQEMCDALNNPEVQEKYGALIGYLKEQGVVEGETGNLKPADSFAAIIDDAGLPTFCSVSGTTGELVCSLVTMADGGTRKELSSGLKGLLDIAHGKYPPDGFDISKFVEPIATFMEVGHFHTTAEVLGGFLSVAVALYAPDTGLPEMQEMFKNLLDYFKAHPQQFLSGTPAAEPPATSNPPPAISGQGIELTTF